MYIIIYITLLNLKRFHIRTSLKGIVFMNANFIDFLKCCGIIRRGLLIICILFLNKCVVTLLMCVTIANAHQFVYSVMCYIRH